MKDAEEFEAELNRPFGEARVVTDMELEHDARSFMAFAGAFGVKPNPDAGRSAALPSATSV